MHVSLSCFVPKDVSVLHQVILFYFGSLGDDLEVVLLWN